MGILCLFFDLCTKAIMNYTLNKAHIDTLNKTFTLSWLGAIDQPRL